MEFDVAPHENFSNLRLQTDHESATTMSWRSMDDLELSNETETVETQLAYGCSVHFKFWFATVGMGLVCLLGILGNTLSILVLQKDSHNRVACFLLQALAFADNMLLLLSLIVVSFMFGFMPWLVNQGVMEQETHNFITVYMVKYANPIASMAQAITIWNTVLLAVNRYVAICKPFEIHKWCTIKLARIQVAVVVSVAVLVNIPRIFSVKIQKSQSTDPESGRLRTQYDILPTALGGSGAMALIYKHVLLSLCIVIVPLTILTVLNTKLVLEVNRMTRRARRNQTRTQIHEQNITLVMIVIILLLIICHTPEIVMYTLSTWLPRHLKTCGTPYYYAFLVTNLLIVLNSSVNFILYYFMRRGFRKILLQKLCLCVKTVYTGTTTLIHGLGHTSQSLMGVGGQNKLKQSKSCPEFPVHAEVGAMFPLSDNRAHIMKIDRTPEMSV